MGQATQKIVELEIDQKAIDLFAEKQQVFYNALKDAKSPYTEAALHNLETFSEYYSVGVTCKTFTISMAAIWGQVFAQIQYPDGTKMTFNGKGWGVGIGAGAGGGGGPATNVPGNLVGEVTFECQFTPIQATAVFYKSDGVACTLIIGGVFPGTPGYLNGSGTWTYGW